jgi:hypothetical protein
MIFSFVNVKLNAHSKVSGLNQTRFKDLKFLGVNINGLMHGWVDQFGCHANQLCLVTL